MSALSKFDKNYRRLVKAQCLAFQLEALTDVLFENSGEQHNSQDEIARAHMLAAIAKRDAKKLARLCFDVEPKSEENYQQDEQVKDLRDLARGLMGAEPFQAWENARAVAEAEAA